MGISKVVKQGQCDVHGIYMAESFLMMGHQLGGRCPKCFEAEEVKMANELAIKTSVERSRQLALLREHSGIPKRFAASSFDGFRVSHEGHGRALIAAKVFAAAVAAQEPGNLLMLGKVGTGKTHLATAIALSLIEQGIPVRYATVRDLIREIRSTWQRGSRRMETEVIDEFGRVPLLILDEVGVQSGSENEMHLLFDVLDRRYGEMLPTVIVSNEDIAGIQATLGERVVDRLRHNGKLQAFDWCSARGKADLQAVV